MKLAVITTIALTDNKPNPVMTRGVLTNEEYKAVEDKDVFIFCRVNNKNEFWIGGWITKEDFDKKADLVKMGDAIMCKKADYDAYRLIWMHLKPIKELEELK